MDALLPSIADRSRNCQNSAHIIPIFTPYHHEELVARVQAVLRRLKNNGQGGNQPLRCGPMELFPGELKVGIAGRAPVALTPTEMKVLRVLMNNPGQTVTRDQLLAEVWNDHDCRSNSVDVYIRRLRMKLKRGTGSSQYILSVRSVGYRFLKL